MMSKRLECVPKLKRLIQKAVTDNWYTVSLIARAKEIAPHVDEQEVLREYERQIQIVRARMNRDGCSPVRLWQMPVGQSYALWACGKDVNRPWDQRVLFHRAWRMSSIASVLLHNGIVLSAKHAVSFDRNFVKIGDKSFFSEHVLPRAWKALMQNQMPLDPVWTPLLVEREFRADSRQGPVQWWHVKAARAQGPGRHKHFTLLDATVSRLGAVWTIVPGHRNKPSWQRLRQQVARQDYAKFMTLLAPWRDRMRKRERFLDNPVAVVKCIRYGVMPYEAGCRLFINRKEWFGDKVANTLVETFLDPWSRKTAEGCLANLSPAYTTFADVIQAAADTADPELVRMAWNYLASCSFSFRQ